MINRRSLLHGLAAKVKSFAASISPEQRESLHAKADAFRAQAQARFQSLPQSRQESLLSHFEELKKKRRRSLLSPLD